MVFQLGRRGKKRRFVRAPGRRPSEGSRRFQALLFHANSLVVTYFFWKLAHVFHSCLSVHMVGAVLLRGWTHSLYQHSFKCPGTSKPTGQEPQAKAAPTQPRGRQMRAGCNRVDERPGAERDLLLLREGAGVIGVGILE